MIRLDTFRRHCLDMARAEHKPDCPTLTAKKPYWPRWLPIDEDGEWCVKTGKPTVGLGWMGPEPEWVPPTCDGCNPDKDRDLFARMAAEVDAYQQGALDDDPTTDPDHPQE